MAILSYTVSYNALQARSTSDIERISTLTSQNIDHIVQPIVQLTKEPLYDSDVQNIIAYYSHHPGISFPSQQDTNKMNTYLFHILTRDDSIQSVYIFSKGQILFGDSFDERMQPPPWQGQQWFSDAMRTSEHPIILSSHINTPYFHNPQAVLEPVFSVARSIVDTNTINFPPLGAILINVNMTAIQNTIQTSQGDTGTQFLISDSHDNLIYSTLEGMINVRMTQFRQPPPQIAFNNMTYLVSTSTSTVSGWTVTALVPRDSISRDIEVIKQTTLFVVCLTLVCVIGLFFLLISTMSRQITQLRHLMKLVETGNLDVRFYDRGNGEIAILGQSFNRMVSRLKRSIENTYEAQLQRQQAELSALQRQINPHFLYNTLASFQMLASREGNDGIAYMSHILGKLMSYTLETAEMIELEYELENVRNYLFLMKERYQDHLMYTLHVDEDLYDCLLPRFTLQPLVENAIYHGIDTRIEPGAITLSVSRQDDLLLVEIADNGVGMSQEKLAQLQAALHYETNVMKRSKHIGMMNIQGRLQRSFGADYGLTITLQPTGGVLVTVCIPIKRQAHTTHLLYYEE